MSSILNRTKQWIVEHKDDIILLIAVVLISLLSFALGFILAKQREKEPIKIEKIPQIHFVNFGGPS